MPPTRDSRHIYSRGRSDSAGRTFLTERVPYRYRDFADNERHTVSQGDTLFSLAAYYFAGSESPSLLWWIIADFQPNPIIDPTIALQPGQVLVIPSLRTVIEEVFSDARYDETT